MRHALGHTSLAPSVIANPVTVPGCNTMPLPRCHIRVDPGLSLQGLGRVDCYGPVRGPSARLVVDPVAKHKCVSALHAFLCMSMMNGVPVQALPCSIELARPRMMPLGTCCCACNPALHQGRQMQYKQGARMPQGPIIHYRIKVWRPQRRPAPFMCIKGRHARTCFSNFIQQIAAAALLHAAYVSYL